MHTNNTLSLILAMIYTDLYTNRDFHVYTSLPSTPPSRPIVFPHSFSFTYPSPGRHTSHICPVKFSIPSSPVSCRMPPIINQQHTNHIVIVYILALAHIQTTLLLYTSSLSHTHKRVAACCRRPFLPWQSSATLIRGLTIEFTKPSYASVLTTLQKPRACPGSRPAATMEQWPLVGRGVWNPAQSH